MPSPRDGETPRLLIAEPPLLVLPSLAVLVGLNEAIFLQQLHYWVQQSGKERDGRRWIYNTYEEWHEQLPFWSVRTIRRIVGTLEERELVVSTTAYNQQRVDQTKWYALDYAALDRLTERADHLANLATWGGQPDQVHLANLAASVPETTSETTNREFDDSNLRKTSRKIAEKYDDARLALLPFAEDLAREFNDQAPLAATTTRLVNLFRASGLDLDPFIDEVMRARAITIERTASIRGRTEGFGPKPKAQYFFAVLADLTSRESA